MWSQAAEHGLFHKAPTTQHALFGRHRFPGVVGAEKMLDRGSCGMQVKALIQEGNADFEARDRWSLDALDEAMRERREDVVRFLQQSGALIGGS